jgi:hypothetical protein
MFEEIFATLPKTKTFIVNTSQDCGRGYLFLLYWNARLFKIKTTLLEIEATQQKLLKQLVTGLVK